MTGPRRTCAFQDPAVLVAIDPDRRTSRRSSPDRVPSPETCPRRAHGCRSGRPSGPPPAASDQQVVALDSLDKGFLGEYTDPLSGRVWMGARWFEPGTASFLTRDTLQGGPSPVSLNRYTHGSADPPRVPRPRRALLLLPPRGPLGDQQRSRPGPPHGSSEGRPGASPTLRNVSPTVEEQRSGTSWVPLPGGARYRSCSFRAPGPPANLPPSSRQPRTSHLPRKLDDLPREV